MVPRGVLLIDDDFNEIISFQKYLTELQLDHTLYIADNIKDALNILCNTYDRSTAPQLILINLETTKLNAVHFLRLIRGYYSLRDVKVFALTEREDAPADIKALDISAVFHKPMDLSFPKDQSSFGDYNLLLNALVS
jgi:CheY-like chemotaxis protein